MLPLADAKDGDTAIGCRSDLQQRALHQAASKLTAVRVRTWCNDSRRAEQNQVVGQRRVAASAATCCCCALLLLLHAPAVCCLSTSAWLSWILLL